MAIHFGNDNIKEIYVGSDKIKEVYYGSEKVWASSQVGYWVHRNTGAITYFGLEESSIQNGIMNQPSWRLDCSEVQIPSGVTGLGANCFQYCASLTSIILPEGITSLGDFCFNVCSSLASITLPESVVSLGQNCFRSCSSLTLATVLPATPPSLGNYGFNNVHTSFSIKVRSAYVNTYKTATNWTAYAAKISAI